ncbi:amino-acid N-acetyltransferase [Arthrobacter sp. UM1]|uniref:amino-acid N-acetyltransferase n=1 Tax=Arthrobacter sp. UM1 TaxID=2766776 RepID=UPI001CF6CCC9|nr:amino-acid N-acetyltransferase [Arthrobacter sp. UM1]MCB4208875.1 amino-acid N-acetyltransferase [Arthrobacter sp. UM1]
MTPTDAAQTAADAPEPAPGRGGGRAGARIRPARTSDVGPIRELVSPLADSRVLVAKEAVAYYESLQEFRVAEDEGGALLGCGAVHVMWEDLAEVRTVAVSEAARGRGIGGMLLERLLEDARALGVSRVFCLTFEVDFFRRHGFEVMSNQDAIDPQVYAELLRSHDEGVAEFLDLARVKPNTLGNTRMIRAL